MSFSDIFSPSQLSYLAVLGQSKINNEDLTAKLGKDIPAELKNYRYLMHPNRLSIMKLLHKNFNMLSTDIKNQVGISWGEYSSHISSLEKKKFLSVHTEFVNGMKVNVVYLEELGRKEFEHLMALLKSFLEDVNVSYFEQDQLYPNKNHTLN